MLGELLPFDNRLELLAGRTLFRKTRLQVHRVAGWEMLVDHSACDAGSIRSLLAGNMYKSLLQSIYMVQMNVMDLGANAGGFPLLLHSLGAKFKRLLAVEMNPNTFKRLKFNLEYNEPNATVINAAAVGAARTLRLALGNGSTMDSIYRGGRRPQREYEIQGRTVDDMASMFGDEVIDIAKIDIEGAESELFLDCTTFDTLSRINHLIIEIHDEKLAPHIHSKIRESGFKLCSGVNRSGCGVHLFSRVV